MHPKDDVHDSPAWVRFMWFGISDFKGFPSVQDYLNGTSVTMGFHTAHEAPQTNTGK